MSADVPTYTPPEGWHGPTLGRDLPDGCERVGAGVPVGSSNIARDGDLYPDCLYWWHPVTLKPGDRVRDCYGVEGTVVAIHDESQTGWVKFDCLSKPQVVRLDLLTVIP